MNKITAHIGLPLVLAVFMLMAPLHRVVAQQDQSVAEQKFIQARSAYVDGLAAFENEDYQKALSLLKSAYVKLPDHPGVNYALADAYLQTNDLGNAEYYGKQAVKLNPENQWYHLKLAHIYQGGGKVDQAVSELNDALKHHPHSTTLLTELARLYEGQDKGQAANTIYNKLLYLQGNNIRIHLKKLRNFNKLGKRDSVLAELHQVRRLDPSNLSTLQVLSNYYLQLDHLQEAREVLEKALAINPQDSQTLIMLSNVYISQAKWDSVGTVLSNVMKDSSTAPHTKLKVAQYLYSKFEEQQDSSIRRATSHVFGQLLQSGTQSSQLLSLAAKFYSKTGQAGQALQALEQTNKLMPTDDSAWKTRLQLLLQQHRTREAVEVGKQAAEAIPQDPLVLYLLASAYLAEQQPSQAIDPLQSASRLPARQPLKARIHGSLGDAYAAADQWKRAVTHYEQSLKLNPDNASVLNNYAYHLAERRQQLDKAQKMARHALELDAGNPTYLDTIGWIFYQQGSYKQAANFIRAAIKTGQASADAMEHLGHVLHKLGKQEQARHWWKKALQEDSTRTHLKDKVST